MTVRQRSEKWTKWRELVARRARDLAFRFGGQESAVALRPIAENCQIRQVVFRPLLVPGGLALDGDRLLMFVKCDEESAEDYSRRFKCNGGIGLPERVRFTIAHEIAHTFFLDWTQEGPVPRVSGTHPSELNSLEAACNYGAGRLLLPEDRFQRFLETDGFLHPAAIKSWAAQLGVSVQTMIVRLGEFGMWPTAHGAVALVRRHNDELRIVAIASDNAAKPLFEHAVRTKDARHFLNNESLSAFDREPCEFPAAFLGSRSERVPCMVACERLRERSNSFVVTVRLIART